MLSWCLLLLAGSVSWEANGGRCLHRESDFDEEERLTGERLLVE